MDTQRFSFLLMGLLSVVLAFGNAGTAVGDCLGHDGARGLGDAWTDSSPCIHKHREGVIVPVEPANSVPPLLSVNVDAEAALRETNRAFEERFRALERQEARGKSE